MKFLLPYLRQRTPLIAFGLFLKTVSSFADLFIPWILSFIIDEVIPLGEVHLVYVWGGIMILTAVFGLLGNVWGNRVAARVSSETVKNVRADLYRRIAHLSNEGVDEFSIPSLISRVTSDSYIVQRTIGMMMRMGVRAPMLLFGCLVITLILDPVLSLVIIAIIPFMLVFSIKVSAKGTRLFKIVQQKSDHMIRVLRENVTGVRIIRALSKTAYEGDRFEKVNEDVTKSDKEAAYNMAKVNPIISLMLNTGYVLVIVVGALRVNTGAGSPGDVLAFMTYVTIILNAVRAISRIFTALSKAAASTGRIEEVMLYEDRLTFVSEENGEAEDENAPAIEFKNVTFSYKNSGIALDNLSFSLKKGETLGVIGTTGSGKTTLISLLMRFYDVSEGEVLLSGKNVKDMTAKELRARFGAVFQNDTLFKDTVKENIAVGRTVSLESIDEAIRNADAEAFLAEAGGLEAQVAIKGANFSGGQKQRMLIARALAGDPEILLLDDSSSALDYKTDSIIRQNLAEKRKGRTTVIVAQRVSSVMHSDLILVLDGGKVMGLGTHESLMKDCPMYRDTYEFQMGGRIV